MSRFLAFCLSALTLCMLSACALLDDLHDGQTRSERAQKKSFDTAISRLVEEIGNDRKAAVAIIEDQKYGDITELSTYWRDRVEDSMRRQGVKIAARKEVKDLLDEAGMFAQDIDWQDYAADILVTGKYWMEYGQEPKVHLGLKSISIQNGEIVGMADWSQPLDEEIEGLASIIRGNINTSRFEQLKSDSENSRESLDFSATLNRKSRCYLPGESIQISLVKKADAYLYIFNLLSDGRVTLLFPARSYDDNFITEKTFVFPDSAYEQKLELVAFPDKGRNSSHEAFKVVISQDPIEIPERLQTIGGSKETNNKEVVLLTRLLMKMNDWNEQTVSYVVSDSCN